MTEDDTSDAAADGGGGAATAATQEAPDPAPAPERRDDINAEGMPRAGPDALYGEHPTPPLLENGPGWEADPLLVAGTDGYSDGEYCYQDHVFDDHGADVSAMYAEPPTGAKAVGGVYQQPTGDYHYPRNEDRYAYNAADLVEFRARPTAEGVAYRITLNTMRAPDAAAVAIGIDISGEGSPEDGEPSEARRTSSDGSGGRETDWGYGLGDLGAPVDHTLVTWGTGAELDGEPLSEERLVVDIERNQIEVEVPLEPGAETWRHYCAVGLWDRERETFKQVGEAVDDEYPGGGEGASDLPPVFNVGFRFDEPLDRNVEVRDLLPRLAAMGLDLPGTLLGELQNPQRLLGRVQDLGDALGETLRDPLSGNLVDPFGLADDVSDIVGDLDGYPRVFGHGNWRETGQAFALAERDISEFHADIDFGKLQAGVTERDLPTGGYHTFLYPSRHDYDHDGVDPHRNVFYGRLQPYSAYIPEEYDPSEPAPLALLLHSLGCSFNQYATFMPNYVKGFAEEYGAIVMTPQARGPGLWYQRHAELDVFEAMRDIRARYNVDMDRVTVSGYSMGGYGVHLLAGKHPDVFARGFSIVGTPSEDPLEGPTNSVLQTPAEIMTGLFGGEEGGDIITVFGDKPENALRLTDNLRHVPMLLWNGVADPLVPILGPANYARRMDEFDYRHRIDVFPGGTHMILAACDEWSGGPEYVAKGHREREPKRVTYKHIPEFDYPDLGLIHDGTYWVDGITAHEEFSSGRVDAITLADGYEAPHVKHFNWTGSRPQPHITRGVEWVDPDNEEDRNLADDDERDGHERYAPANALNITCWGVEEATIHLEGANLDPTQELRIDYRASNETTLVLSSSGGEREVTLVENRDGATVTVEPLA
jgi:pimeloyl-ACP methyl ester carboxylesterase